MSDTKIPPNLTEQEFLVRTKNVSDECFLRSLQEWRRGGREVREAQRDDSIRIMSEMYSDSTHFVYELLQNAEDAAASKVAFSFEEGALVMTHNGKPFSRRDLISITTAGRSGKKDELNAIGKFGVGFKAVFAVTDAPEIYSGNFRLRIENYTVPSPLSSLQAYNAANQTVIRLPLKRSVGDDLWERVRKTVSGLSSAAMVFMNNIRRLEWEDKKDGAGDFCEMSGKLDACGGNIEAGHVEFCGKNADNRESYFLLRRPEKLNGKSLYLSVAYRMSGGGIVPMNPTPSLSVYFPVAKENLGMPFMLHVPYKTTPNRETCDFNDADNKVLTARAAAFIANTLPILRDKGKLTPAFINDVLPWSGSHDVRNAIYGEVKEKLLSDKLLPTACGKYATARDVIRTDEYMPRIVDAPHCLSGAAIPSDTWKNPGNSLWLHNKIDFNWDVQRALKIERAYGIDDFLRGVDDECLRQFSDAQMLNLYRVLLMYFDKNETRGYNERYKRRDDRVAGVLAQLKSSSIVRLEKERKGKRHVSAFRSASLFDIGKPFVYLPKEGVPRNFPTVAPFFLEDGKSARFLKDVLGIKEPDDIAEVREIVRRYGGEIALGDHVADMRRILEIAAANTEAVRDEIAGQKIVKTANGSGADGFVSFGRSFFRTTDLLRIFAGNPGVHFVDDVLYEKEFGNVAFPENAGWRGLFKRLGVRESFRIPVTGDIGVLEHSLSCIEKSGGSDEFDRSVAVWQLLDDAVDSLPRSVLENTLRRKFEREWIYNKDKVRISVSEIGEHTLEDIHPEYKEKSAKANALLLSKVAGLKYEDVAELQRKLMEKDNALDKSTAELERAREKIRELEAKLSSRGGDSGANKEGGARNGNDGGKVGDPDMSKPRKIKLISDYFWADKEESASGGGGIAVSCGENAGGDSAKNKAKGKVGEAALYKWLNDQRRGKVTDANANGEQKGYDISVDMPDGVTAYYECKSFDSATPPRRVQMTRAQMEKAEAAEDVGDQYFLCVIFDIDGDPVSMLKPIRNPAKLAKTETRWSVDISSGAEE